MALTIIDWLLSLFSNFGTFATWLFTPINYDSVFSSILYRYFGITLGFRPVDLLTTGILTTIVIFGLIKIVLDVI